MPFFLPPGCSFSLLVILGTKMDDTQNDSWSGRFMVWLYLATKAFHMGGRYGRASLPSALAYNM
jgi:hypothetical protein